MSPWFGEGEGVGVSDTSAVGTHEGMIIASEKPDYGYG
jgi:hypothetical protein